MTTRRERPNEARIHRGERIEAITIRHPSDLAPSAERQGCDDEGFVSLSPPVKVWSWRMLSVLWPCVESSRVESSRPHQPLAPNPLVARYPLLFCTGEIRDVAGDEKGKIVERRNHRISARTDKTDGEREW